MNRRKSNIALCLVFLIFGFLVTLQVRSVYVNNQSSSGNEALRMSELTADMLLLQNKNAELTEQLATYKEELDNFREEASSTGNYAKLLADQLNRAEIMSGAMAVSGPGVIVTIKDSTDQALPGLSENNYIIHSTDLLEIVNELRDAGAEALAVNGERLISTSEVRCAGSTVSVNNTRYGAPFVITAIGDPATLEASLRMRGGILDSLAYWGIPVTIEPVEKLQINAYNGMISYKYAQPLEKEAKQ